MIPIIYHPIYSELDLPSQHRYPIEKYRLLYQALRDQQEDDAAWQQMFATFTPTPLTLTDVIQVHCPEYIHALFLQ